MTSCTFIALALLLVFAAAAAQPASTTVPADKNSQTSDDLFSSTNVVRIQIEIPNEGMEKLRRYHWRSDRGREDVKATVREGEKVYRDVAIHLKGAAGSFRPIDDRPALTVNFDKFVKGQTFHRVQKISLNNSVQDPTYLNEKISRELLAAAGVPVPRAGHALVELNGRKLGLYVLTEGFNKQFLKRHFKNAKGNLYDGGFVSDIDAELAVNSGDHPQVHSGLKALRAVVDGPVSSNRWHQLNQVLDTDRFISMLAMEILLCHWDGYTLNVNNYRIYHDPDSNKMIFIPHGLDQMFGYPEQRAPPSLTIFPPMRGMVARAVMQTPEGRRLYVERLSQLLTHTLKVESLTNRVNALAAQLRPLAAERARQSARGYDQRVTDFCERIAFRAESVKEQLAMLDNAVKFDATGVVKLRDDWKSKMDFGRPTIARAEVDGKPTLKIGTEQGSSVGSWRTKLFLEGGRYRLEGQVKTEGIAADPGDRRGGAGLRVVPGSRRQFFIGTTNWTNVGLDFEVRAGWAEVELVCESRAAKGEVWFDVNSLKLIRK